MRSISCGFSSGIAEIFSSLRDCCAKRSPTTTKKKIKPIVRRFFIVRFLPSGNGPSYSGTIFYKSNRKFLYNRETASTFLWIGLVVFEEMNKGLGDGGECSMTMENLIEISLQLQSPNGNLLEKAISNLALDRGAGEYGNAKSCDQGFLDRLSAPEFHSNAQKLLRLIAFAA